MPEDKEDCLSLGCDCLVWCYTVILEPLVFVGQEQTCYFSPAINWLMHQSQ